MPVCTTCDGSEFTCQDGLFYCVMCDTQSQDFVDEQATEVLGESYSTKKLKKKSQAKKQIDKGLPWHSVEGFQLIIKDCIKSLIDLGVSPSLDDVVKQLWFKFVHKSGMAVIDESQATDKNCIPVVRFRDFFLRYFKEEVLPVRSSIKLRFSKRSRLSSSANPDSSAHLAVDEEWFSVDTAVSESEDDEQAETVKKSKRDHVFAHYKDHVISSSKVVSLCFLALQWCQEPVTIGDLLLWIDMGYLPYYGGAECLLPHMKLSAWDYVLYSKRNPPSYYQLVVMSNALAKYLDMPPLPDVPIMGLVTRYLVQLNLPTALASFIHKLSKKLKYSRSNYAHVGRAESVSAAQKIRFYCPDLVAAALIALALKILFTLNDKEEWIERQGTCLIHEDLQHSSCNIFTWKNWVREHLLQQENKMQNGFTFSDHGSSASVGDVHACMELYLNVLMRGQHKKKSLARSGERLRDKTHVFNRLAMHQGSEEVKMARTEKRKSLSSAYKRLGFVDEQHSTDFTDACISSLMKDMMMKDSQYVLYKKEGVPQDEPTFHESYTFLLEILRELTYADTLDLHGAICYIENQVLQHCLPPYPKSKNPFQRR